MKNQVAIVIAVILGILAVIAVRAHLQKVEEAKDRETTMVNVVMAKRDIEKNEQLTLKNIEKETASIQVLEGTTVIPWSEKEFYINMYRMQQKVPKGRFITKEMLLRAGKDRLAKNLEEGERAITVAVDQVSGMGGYLSPGDHVDVFATFTVPATGVSGQSRAEVKTYLLLTNVKILATGAKSSQRRQSKYGMKDTPYTTITFKTTQQAAHILTYSQAVGRLNLVLRAPGDMKKHGATTMGMTGLINLLESRPR